MRRSLVGLLLVACTVPVTACDDIAGEDTGRITVLLTDAPGDVVAAVVTISSIYIQPGEPEGEDDDEAGAGDRIVLRTEPVTTDLLTLRDDVAALVEGAVLPSGRYGQLRFVLSGAYIEVEGDEGNLFFATPGYEETPVEADGVLQCPSCGQSGLKINLPGGFEVEEGEEQSVLVDFDVSQSFGKEAGNSARWVMHPTITATSTN